MMNSANVNGWQHTMWRNVSLVKLSRNLCSRMKELFDRCVNIPTLICVSFLLFFPKNFWFCLVVAVGYLFFWLTVLVFSLSLSFPFLYKRKGESNPGKLSSTWSLTVLVSSKKGFRSTLESFLIYLCSSSLSLSFFWGRREGGQF